MMLRSGLGTGAWGAFEAALSRVLGLTVGNTVQLVGACLVVIAWTMKVPPSIVTLLNVVSIGFFVDRFLQLIPAAEATMAKIVLCVLGVVMYSLGSSRYLSAACGSGPRDSVMLGVSRNLNTSIRAAKISIDLTVLALAALLKGPIGIGTVVYALASGPLIQFFLVRMGYRQSSPQGPSRLPDPCRAGHGPGP